MRRRADSSGWPAVQELVPPELPPDVAVRRLVALAQSLLTENRELRDALAIARRRSEPDVVATLHPRRDDGGAEAA